MSSRPRSASRPASFGRLVWIVPVCGLLALGLTWWLLLSMLQAERAQAQDSAVQRVRGMTRAFEAHTRSALRQVDQTARFVAYSYQQQAAALDLDAIMRQSGPATPGVVGLHVADAQGNVVASTVSGPMVNVADREHFKVHVNGRFDGLFVSKPVLGRLSKRWTVQMSRRIEGADGRFLGVTIVSADPVYFTSFYNEQQFGQRGLVSLIGLDGVVRGRRIGEQVWYGTANAVAALPRALGRSAEGVLQDTSQVDGRARWVGYRQLDGYPLVVLAGLDEQEVLVAYEMHRATVLRLMATVSAAVVLLLAGLAWLLRRLQASHLAAARAEKRIRAIADNIPALVAYIDREGHYRFTNAYYAAKYGKAADLFVGRPVKEMLGESAYGQLQPHLEAALRGESRRFERHATEHGLDMHFLVRYEPDTNEQGEVVGVHVVSLDITERKQAELLHEASERRLKLVADHVPALISHLDADGCYLYANRHFERLLGIDPSQLIGRPLAQARDAGYVAQVAPAVQAVLSGHEVEFESTLLIDGVQRYFQQHYVPDVDDAQRVNGFYSITFDITERMQDRERLADSERRLQNIADNLPVLISYIDRDRQLRFLNRTFKTWMGLEPALAIGHDLEEVVGPELFAQRAPYLERALAGERVSFAVESVAQGVKRHLQTDYVPDLRADGSVAGVYTLSTDVTHLKEVERRLSAMARTDTLTGLPNRLHFHERLGAAQARQRRSGKGLALLYLDVDRFKRINDAHGHAGGDVVLKEFGQRLRRCVRETDTVARLAGDEFVILLEGLREAAEAEKVARKVLAAFDAPVALGEQSLAVATSIGVVFDEAAQRSPDDLLATADEALYRAKRLGRGRVQVWSEVQATVVV
jgi:diguanylate cyclase (GGDEF)-like protein/PAS domain S-box-containing protein